MTNRTYRQAWNSPSIAHVPCTYCHSIIHRYDAEVHLIHFYEKKHKRKAGKVAIFLEATTDVPRWGYLDKLICQWREVEEATRKECGLPSVTTTYPYCRNPRRGGDSSVVDSLEVPSRHTDNDDPFPWIDCDTVDNTFRICKPDSCCERAGRRPGDFCTGVFNKHGHEIESICHWCCSGKSFNPPRGFSVKTAPASPRRTPAPVPVLPAPDSRGSSNFRCSNYPDKNFDRICRDGGCCDSVRSSSTSCHREYNFFGDDMANVCSKCCNPRKQVAPAPPPHPKYPPINCARVDNPFRICKPTSCCNSKRTDNRYCNEVYDQYPGNRIGSICWYCCSEPKEVGPELRRNRQLRGTATDDELLELTSSSSSTVAAMVTNSSLVVPTPSVSATSTYASTTTTTDTTTMTASYAVSSSSSSSSVSDELPSIELTSSTMTNSSSVVSMHLPDGRRPGLPLQMDPVNFMVNENLEHDYLDSIDQYEQEENDSRRLARMRENYEQVNWRPYHWMRKVKTEYYYRYEGTQAVPPCYERVHWRVMKDPIRVHPDQIKELERLLAERIAPKGSEFNQCARDTAGKKRPGTNGKVYDFNRPLQSNDRRHYQTMCEVSIFVDMGFQYVWHCCPSFRI